MSPDPSSSPAPASAPAQGKLILIVDDDDAVRDLMEFVVRREGFNADKAGDGQEALVRIDKTRPDLILLDLMLPKYGGFEVLRRLQGGEYKGIPIIVISGKFVDAATIDMIRQESNVVEFIAKPVRPPQLMAVVHRVLNTHSPHPPTKA